MNKKSCGALHCNDPCSPEPGTSGVSPRWVECILELWLSLICLQSSWLCLLCLWWAGFGPYAKRSVWVVMGLQLGGRSSQIRCLLSAYLQELQSYSTTECSPCVVLRSFCWWAGLVVRPDACQDCRCIDW